MVLLKARGQYGTYYYSPNQCFINFLLGQSNCNQRHVPSSFKPVQGRSHSETKIVRWDQKNEKKKKEKKDIGL